MVTSFYQIAKNTLRETLREPIYLLLLLTALCLIGIYPIFTLFAFRQQVKLVVDSAMATMMVLGWLMAILSASHAISREIENGTALLLLSKPVQRPIFIVAKIVGILLALTVFCLLCASATVISIRVAKDQFRLDNTVLAIYFGVLALSVLVGGIHNYITRSSFPMAAVISMLGLFPLMLIGVYYLPVKGEHVGFSFEVVPALVLILYSVWAMGSLATALSTRLGLVNNLMVCVVIFIVGLMSDYLLGRHAREPWNDSVPRGHATLWISNYRFVPTETMSVGRWSRPKKVERADTFVVWSDETSPGRLTTLGVNPEKVWQDGNGWARDPQTLSAPPVYMATYNPNTLTWKKLRVIGEQDKGNRENGERSFVSYVFRRSLHRPRTPRGGTYENPYPNPGSRLASVLYACVPNWQLFWMADALAAKQAIPGAYIAYGGLYAVLVVGLCVLLAVALFWQREVGTQMMM